MQIFSGSSKFHFPYINLKNYFTFIHSLLMEIQSYFPMEEIQRTTMMKYEPEPEPPKKHCYTMQNNTRFEIDTKYEPLKVIGEGAFGVVCSAINTETNEKVAIKKISDVFGDPIDGVRIAREMFLLRHLVYELMDTDLHRIIVSSKPLDQEHCQYLMFQILRGLKYLHSANVLHRDLKPRNIFINADCNLKIGDLGISRTASWNKEPMTEYVVTRWYRAPELLLSCRNYTAAVDIWSAGCIFAEILGRKAIFQGKDALNQIKIITDIIGYQSESDFEFIEIPRAKEFMRSINVSTESKLPSLFPGADPMAIDLLSRMLTLNPSKRMTAEEALHHPYMEDLFDPMEDFVARYKLNIGIDESAGEVGLREMIRRQIECFQADKANAAAADAALNVKVAAADCY